MEPEGPAAPAGPPATEMSAGAEDDDLSLAAHPASGPRLPESCKLLLKQLAEEMLVMHSTAETAEHRAELAERKLQRRAGRQGALAAEQARAQAAEATAQLATLQQQLEEAQKQVKQLEGAQKQLEQLVEAQTRLEQVQKQLQQERRLRQAAEQRAAELERQLATAQPPGQRQQQQQGQQQQQQGQQQQQDEDMRRLGREMLAGPRAAAAAPQAGAQQQQRQQQQRQQPIDRPLPPEQPEAGAAGGGGQPSLAVALNSSDDDETFRDAVPGPAAVAAAPAAAVAGQADAKQKGEVEPARPSAAAAAAAGEPGQMRPPPQRLGTLRGAVNPAKQAGSKKRPADGTLAAAAAAAGKAQAAQRGEMPPAAKQQRREAGGGSTQQRPDSASPGESAADALDALNRRLRRSSSAAAAADGDNSLSPRSRKAGPDLLLQLADAGQDGWEEEEEWEGEEEEEGQRRRNGRRGGGAVAGVVTLKAGETAEQWLNRTIAAYVRTLAGERDFRPFEKPVPRSTPDYYRLVKQPMDLATVKIKAQRGQYETPREFKSDMLLIVNNAKFYNESQKHPVHQAAERLHDYLRKPHSFFSKVEAEFKQAETAAVLNEERAAQEAELEEEEERLASSVEAGMNIAVYGADDINRNYYYLLQAVGPVRRLRADDTDDFGITYKKGDEVIEGHYYDYWVGPDGSWDRSGGKRPYYLQDDRRGLVPASSLLLVDFELQQREETQQSPFDGSEQALYDVAPDLHQALKRAIRRFTAELA